MRFQDIAFLREENFSVGFDEGARLYYISIPVSNGLVDYEEYYRIPEEWAKHALDHLEQLRPFAEKCRLQEEDSNLILKPGSNRGVAV